MTEQTSSQTGQGQLPGKLKDLLRSRKFWAAVVSIALIILKAFRPDIVLDEAQITLIVVTLASFILGVAIEDNGKAVR
jgi:hypothetical protein